MNQAEVFPLKDDSYDEAAKVMGRAFRDNPPVLSIFEGLDSKEREERMKRGFFSMLKVSGRRGWLLQARKDGRLVGVGIIHHPGAYPLPVTAQVEFILRFILRNGYKGLGQFVKLSRAYDKIHKKYLKAPHYYFEMLGAVEGAAGLKIIREVIHKADKEGVGVYAESSDPRNDSGFERFGFNVVTRKEVIGVPVSFIWRPPQCSCVGG